MFNGEKGVSCRHCRGFPSWSYITEFNITLSPRLKCLSSSCESTTNMENFVNLGPIPPGGSGVLSLCEKQEQRC
uniref:Uncharacterized protein n=1 Tax=Anguilla anguilla TaxID=7936 RepID=A0A0E9UC13_ANGAN